MLSVDDYKKTNMESIYCNLYKALKLYLFYILIVLIATPLAVYAFSFLIGKYLLGWSISFDFIFLNDISLILGSLLIILLFIKKGYTNVNKSCSITAMASFDKGLLLWILILELSSILPINMLVAFLDFGDFATSTSVSALSIAAIVGTCLLAPFAEELVMRGGVEEYLLRWKQSAGLAIVLSSLLFGILHLSPSMIVVAFLNGLLYGWVYYRSRNIVVCFLMHMINNVASCLAGWLRPDDSTSLDILFQTRMIIITLFCVVFMVTSLVTIKKKTAQG